jgi:hypothetical protein
LRPSISLQSAEKDQSVEMAVDPAGATLASIGLFLQLYNICDTKR